MFNFFRRRKKTDRREELDFFDEISHSVESGEYFKDMRKWYNEKYISVSSERVLMIIITIIVLFCTMIMVRSCNQIFPIQHDLPIVIEIDDQANYYLTINRFAPLDARSNESNAAVRLFYVHRFINTREAYNDKYNRSTTKANQRFIRDHANDEIYNGFLEEFNTQNYKSWKIQYRNHTERQVIAPRQAITMVNRDSKIHTDRVQKLFPTSLKSKEFYRDHKNYYTALVDFAISEVNKTGTETNNWAAKVILSRRRLSLMKKLKSFCHLNLR